MEEKIQQEKAEKAVKEEVKEKKVVEKKVAEQKKTEKRTGGVDPWTIIKYPLLTEKIINSIEKENKLVFIADLDSTKRQIKWAVEKALEVKVYSVNTSVDRKGRKKAYVRLNKEFRALDIATRFGML